VGAVISAILCRPWKYVRADSAGEAPDGSHRNCLIATGHENIPRVTAEDARKTVGSEGTGHLEQRIGSVAPAALFGQQALDLVRVEGGATPTARSIAQTAAGKPILQLRRIYLAVIPG
jgi:hypothetical protein